MKDEKGPSCDRSCGSRADIGDGRLCRGALIRNHNPICNTPWDSVVQDYELKGYTESTFRNRYGNHWNVWTSAATRNTLIWSKTNNAGRGEGFNCTADARPNFWGSCTRYDLRSGQVNGKVSVSIVDGTVIDRPLTATTGAGQ